jgi:hypothetical protein
MTTYKVGDKVRVVDAIRTQPRFDGVCKVTPDMAKMAGKTVTITDARTYDWRSHGLTDHEERYSIKECSWNWSPSMFEPLCKFKVDPKYFELVSNDVELTLEDIAKLAGLDPSQIRIMK